MPGNAAALERESGAGREIRRAQHALIERHEEAVLRFAARVVRVEQILLSLFVRAHRSPFLACLGHLPEDHRQGCL